jgi:hypothetical protein
MDGHTIRGMINAHRRPVTSNHGEHPLVAGQHVHRHDGRAAGLCPGDERAGQRGTHALALPPVGHHDTDLRHRGAVLAFLVRGHGMPDDGAADGRRDHGVDIAAVTQAAEHGRRHREPAEESEVAGPHGQAGEEVPEHGQVRGARPPDRDGSADGGLTRLGSAHEPRIGPIAESVNQI